MKPKHSLKTLASVAALGVCIQSSASIEVVNNTGDSLGGEVAFTAEAFSVPTMNDFGEIAFAANFEELDNGTATRFEGVGLFDGNVTRLLATANSIAPKPGDDGAFEHFYKPEISELGIAFFRGKMQGSEWAENTKGTWLGWNVTKDGQTQPKLDMLNRVWDRASIDFEGNRATEGGYFHQIGHPQVVEPRAFAFVAELEDDAYENVSGVWFQGANASGEWEIPRPDLIALQGSPLPGHTNILGIIESYTPIDEETGLLLARLQNSTTINESNDLALYLTQSNGDAIKIVQSGDIDPASGSPFASFASPHFIDDGRVVFWAALNNADQDEGIYQYESGGIASLLSSSQTQTIGSESIDIHSILGPKANASGSLSVWVEQDNGEHALLLCDQAGNWSILARTGMQAPGGNLGALFHSFNLPRINANGQVCFIATLTGEDDAISDTSDSGIWATDTNGTLTLVGREGDLINAGGNKLRTLSSFSIGSFTESGKLSLLLHFTNHSSAIATASVDLATAPVITQQPTDISSYNGEEVELSVTVDGIGPFTYQWSKDGVPIDGATNPTLIIADATPSSEGAYSVSITSPIGQTISHTVSLSLEEWTDIPVFAEEPLGEIALMGAEAVLTARAVSNLPITYQWYKDNVAIDEAVDPQLRIPNATAENEGAYHVVATSSAGSAQSASATVLVTDKRLINISTRAHIGTGANVVIAGFVVKGDQTKKLLIRGIGPSLAQHNIDGFVEQPQLLLFKDGENIDSNSGWSQLPNTQEIVDAAAAVGAFAIDAGSEDAVLLVDLEPGAYTAMLLGENQTTGIGLVEVYEVEQTATRLINISSRAHVGNGHEIAIPGVVIEGDQPSTVLVRAVGPGLAQFDLPGILARPVLQVIDSEGDVIASNVRWQDVDDLGALENAMQTVGAFPLDDNSEDAALLAVLEPGVYTALVYGEDGTTGLSLVEVYSVPTP